MSLRDVGHCPNCKAENAAHRRCCWHCKHTLPTWFALDASIEEERRAVQDACSGRVDAEPVIVLGRESASDPEPVPDAQQPSQRLVWFLREHVKPA